MKEIQDLNRTTKKKSQCIHNSLIKEFLSNDANFDLFVKAQKSPTNENMEKLDTAFKMFFSEIRFIKYLSKTIYFFSIDFDKFKRKYDRLYRLIMDQPLEEYDIKST